MDLSVEPIAEQRSKRCTIGRAIWLAVRTLAWGVWWLLVVAAGLLTLGGFAARWDFFWEVACHFRVQYFWLLAGLTLVPLLLRRWKLAVVPAVLAIINLAVIVPLYFGGSTGPASGRILRVLSLNVEAQNREFDAVLGLIEENNPDVVVLLDESQRWEREMAPLKQRYPYSRVLASPGGSGIGFYSRIEPERIEMPNIGLRARPIVVASFSIDGKPLTIIAAHTRSPRSDSSLADRNYQLAELAQIAKNTPGQVMLIGDLNSTSWSPDFAELLNTSGLVDSRRGRGVQPTWPAHVPLVRIPIDHCLVSPEVKIHDRRVEKSVGSDHLPIVVDFSLQ